MPRNVVGRFVMVAVIAAWSSQPSALLVQTPVAAGFTYQGRLTDGDAPARGLYDFEFTLYDALKDGTQFGPRVTQNDIEVTNGLFTVILDFGAVFSGTKRWLQIGVRPAASDGEYVVLKPRQELTPAPDSLFSQGTPWTGVSGKPSGFADNQDNDVLGGLTCSSGQVPKWTGIAWACATDADGDTGVNAVTGGGGITGTLAGRTLTLGSDATVQRRTVAPTCPTGQFVRSIAADGTPTCAADADSGGDITGVTPGTGLTGGGTVGGVTLNVDLAGKGSATTVSRSDHTHVLEAWSASAALGGQANSGAVLSVTNTHASGLPGGFSDAIWGRSNAPNARALAGYAACCDTDFNVTYGVWGRSDSRGGRGVFGWAAAASGTNYGVYGQTNSPDGLGVYGRAEAASGTNYGVYGETFSADGYGGYFKGRIGTDKSIDFGNTTRQMINLFNADYAIGVQPDTHYFRSFTNFAWFKGGSHADAALDAGTGGTRQMRLDSSGNLFVRGTVNPGGADFAEMLPAQDASLEPGDVLVIGLNGELTRSTEPYQSTLAGVYSTKPGLIGGAADGEDTTGKIPLAVAGVVPVKVTDENGPIRPGDSLTSSTTPGHAMRASKLTINGVVIGKALEPLGSGKGVIRALVVLQ